MESTKSGTTSGRRPVAAGLGVILAAAALLAAVNLAVNVGNGSGSPKPGATPSFSFTASLPEIAAPRSAPPSPLVTPTASPTPTPAPTNPRLPALLGAIGDSYSQAWNVAPAYPRDHPAFSWVIGNARNDGVFSLLERLQALGAAPKVVDAATSGKKMNDAPRQAQAVVAAAAAVPSGQTAYITFELGTNDLCDEPMTSPADFEASLRSAMAILRSGLPPGSRILMLSVPDFAHLRDITQADSKARASLAVSPSGARCAPFLGNGSTATLGQAETYLALYDSILEKVCGEVESAGTPSGTVSCTYDQARLSLDDFTIADMSTADYFHPSLKGQARIADAAWAADVWGSVPMPPGALSLAPDPFSRSVALPWVMASPTSGDAADASKAARKRPKRPRP